MLEEKFILESVTAFTHVLLFNQKHNRLSFLEEKKLKKDLIHFLMVTFEDPLKKEKFNKGKKLIPLEI